jgi:hypothetical protein
LTGGLLFASLQVIDLVNELIDEMDLAEDAIAAKATTHIHANEVILTFGLSQTTLKFLLKAAERRSFQVLRFFPPEEHVVFRSWMVALVVVCAIVSV